MALSHSSIHFSSISSSKPLPSCVSNKNLNSLLFSFAPTTHIDSPKHKPLRVNAASSSSSKARFLAKRSESTSVRQLQRPLVEYMSLPASQYSVLDAERIERVDENTFRCYVYRLKFFAFEVCPVLLVRVDEEPNGCCIRLLSSSMENRISCSIGLGNSSVQQLTSDTTIEVVIDIPFAFQAIPVGMIESTGTQVIEQLLKIMLPRFLMQLVKDYQAWASGDTSRQPLGTGEI